LLKQKTKRSKSTKQLLCIPGPAAVTRLLTFVSASPIRKSPDLATVSLQNTRMIVMVTDITQHSSSTASIIKPKSSRKILASPTQRSPRSSANSGATRQLRSKPSGKLSRRRKSSAINSSILTTAISLNATVVAAASPRTHLAQPSRNPSVRSVAEGQSLHHRRHILTRRTLLARRPLVSPRTHPTQHQPRSAGPCPSFATSVCNRRRSDACVIRTCHRTITTRRTGTTSVP
jgi:hypothetical protein